MTYETTVDEGDFVVLLSLASYATMWDRILSRALIAAHEYVASTHLLAPDGDGDGTHRLVVSVDGALTWARVEEMETTIERAWAQELGQ